ncbi:MAG: transcriptional regulator [Euryarchaeota archaeon]|nr:transcriptional regulator [Euryarchaeota archaeon]
MSKDQAIGGLICLIMVAIAAFYVYAIYQAFMSPPNLKLLKWGIGVPVVLAMFVLIGIGFWLGYEMATTPAPKPLEPEKPAAPASEEEKKE